VCVKFIHANRCKGYAKRIKGVNNKSELIEKNYFCRHHYLFSKIKLSTMQDITVSELKKRLDSGDKDFLFIDVREPYEYEEFNLDAKLIPLGTLVQAASTELADDKDTEILIHCRSGARSGQAKMILMNMGFTKVRNVEGGVLAWRGQFG
jgi:rhodanese-related sulfurtransferase